MYARPRHQWTSYPPATQVGAACVAMVLMMSGVPVGADAQGLPFAVSIIDWEPASLERQRRAFRSAGGEYELLFCVESWTRTVVGDGIDRIVIGSVRRERAGTKTRIRNAETSCVGTDGQPLPMFHTHSDGNCQLSPNDLITLVARAAPFEGVQCGERHFVWAFAWHVVAIAAAVELGRLEAPSASGGSQSRNTARSPTP